MPRRIVIIGGVAGGMSAAARLRRLDESAEITVLERSGHVSYANCGLPYYVGGVIAEESDLLLQTPASLWSRFRLDVRVGHEATGVDLQRHLVTYRDLASGETGELAYDALVLSPGARPVIPPVPGVERARVLRTVEDARALHDDLDEGARTAVVIGGGFVGLEVAENLAGRGLATTVVEASPQVLAPLDPELASLVSDHLEQRGVGVRLGATVERIDPHHAVLSTGEVLDADVVVAAIGVRPETTLAREAGLRVGPRGGIAVDDQLRTSDPDVYAVGDAAEVVDALDHGSALVPLANLANHQGRTVADTIMGRRPRAITAHTTAIVRVFGLTAAVTGWNEKRLAAAGRDYVAVHTHPAHHAGYFPGARTMALKVLVDPATGTILGAQGVGAEGVDKRIDVIATARHAGLPATELADLELAYAPPFGSAKDPVNMLGYVAQNALSGLDDVVQWSDVDGLRAAGATLVDVRTREEFAAGTIPGAINVQLDDLRARLGDLPRDLVVFCEVGQRGHAAARLLAGHGVRAANLDGGYRTWAHSPAAALEPAAR